MKKHKLPDIDDLLILPIIILERESGQNANYFKKNERLLHEEWFKYLSNEGDISKFSPNASPWIQKKKTLINLYDQPTGIHEEFISSMREDRSYRLCTYCGIPSPASLDHYFPKAHYPQFSILSKNLVPSCYKCNQDKQQFQCAPDGAYYPHGYFDNLDQPLYFFKFSGKIKSPQISTEINSKLPAKLRGKIEFLFNDSRMNIKNRLVGAAVDLYNELVENIEANIYKKSTFLVDFDRDLKKQKLKFKTENSIDYRFYVDLKKSSKYFNALSDYF